MLVRGLGAFAVGLALFLAPMATAGAQTGGSSPPPPTDPVNAVAQPVTQGLLALRAPIQEAARSADAAHGAQVQAEAQARDLAAEAAAAATRFEETRRSLILQARADYVAPLHVSSAAGNTSVDPIRALEYLRVRLAGGAAVLVEARTTRARLDLADAVASKAAGEAQARSAAADAALTALTALQQRQTELAQGLETDVEGDSGLAVSLTSVPLVRVEGIVVHAAIGQQVASLLGAARAAGLHLGGSGYRSSDRQVELRRAHCGPTDFDVFDRPAGECVPPTARPGRSMHERGLAIDFTDGGSLIVSRDEPAWQWLAANGLRYGLRNLASEPWHWSVNGN